MDPEKLRVWGTTSDNEIYYCEEEGCLYDEWSKVSGSLKDLSVKGKIVWGLGTDDKIYCCEDDKCKEGDWTTVSGGLRTISIGKNKVWGVSSDSKVWFRSDVNCEENGNWQQVPGIEFQDVSADENENVWGIDKEDNVKYCNGDTCKDGTFDTVDDLKLKKISAYEGGVIGINEDNEVYYCSHESDACEKGKWNGPMQNTKMNDISAWGETIWGTDKEDSVYYCYGEGCESEDWIKSDIAEFKHIASYGDVNEDVYSEDYGDDCPECPVCTEDEGLNQVLVELGGVKITMATVGIAGAIFYFLKQKYEGGGGL